MLNGFRKNANLAIYSQLRSYWDFHEQEIFVIHVTKSMPLKYSSDYEQPCLQWGAASGIDYRECLHAF
jgi:hypothetical protein